MLFVFSVIFASFLLANKLNNNDDHDLIVFSCLPFQLIAVAFANKIHENPDVPPVTDNISSKKNNNGIIIHASSTTAERQCTIQLCNAFDRFSFEIK